MSRYEKDTHVNYSISIIHLGGDEGGRDDVNFFLLLTWRQGQMSRYVKNGALALLLLFGCSIKKISTSIIQHPLFIQEVMKGAVMTLTFSCC